MALSARTEFGHAAGSLESVRAAVGLPRPVSLSDLARQYREDCVFAEPIVTDGSPLGGRHALTVRRDGSFRYQGHFRATGWPSYTVAVVTTLSYEVRPPGGAPHPSALVVAAQGRVHGTNETGDRSYAWDHTGHNPLLAAEWDAVRRGQLHRELAYDSDWLGFAGDVVSFIGQVVVFGSAFGAVGAGLVVAGTAADLLDVEQIALPGLVGLVAAAGAVFVLGPSALLPAFVGGAVASAALVRQRHLTDAEVAFVDRVFRGTVPYDRVLLTNLLGVGNRPFVSPAPGGAILVNLGDGYEDPVSYTGKGSGGLNKQAPGQLLVHELTHAWQIENESFTPEYYCRSYGTALSTVEALGGDDSAYEYGPPGAPWNDIGPERQASIVDDWFAGSTCPESTRQRVYAPMAEDHQGPGPNPYYRYIRDNIRTGISS